MKKTIQSAAALLLAMVMAVSALTVSAFAKSDKSNKSSKADKDASSAVCGEFAAVTPDQAKEIALDDAKLDAASVKYVVCYVSWANHAPYAYEVKFSTRAASYHYTIDLNSGAIRSSICRAHR